MDYTPLRILTWALVRVHRIHHGHFLVQPDYLQTRCVQGTRHPVLLLCDVDLFLCLYVSQERLVLECTYVRTSISSLYS